MKQVLVSRALSGVYFKASSEIEVLEEYEGETGQFLKTFAINDKRNKNGWRATWPGARKSVDTVPRRDGRERFSVQRSQDGLARSDSSRSARPTEDASDTCDPAIRAPVSRLPQ